MAKKKLTLLQKASILLNLSIFLAKLKKPIAPVLVSLKKSRKLKLLKPYDHYSYVKEYEFSPSSTPLIQFQRKFKRERLGSFRKVYSNFVVVSECFGLGKHREVGLEMENGVVMSSSRELMVVDSNENSYEYSYSYSSEEDSSVDERAERFIQRFYEDMRRQRQEAPLQILDV